MIFSRTIESKKRPLALSQTEEDWKSWFKARGKKPYCARQVMEWCFRHQIRDPLLYANLSSEIREELAREFDWHHSEIESILSSSDGSDKLLLRTPYGGFIESVLMPYENRVALCISSQRGCRMGCSFCQTGKIGFQGNLESGEILDQVLVGAAHARARGIENRISNVVFMGMGEPLDNFDEVVKACKILLDPRFFCLSRHRVTVSTCGLVPHLRKLGEELPIALAISLHSADDEVRSQLMPINRKFPLSELKKALLEYPLGPRDHFTFEYMLIDGVNDSLQDVKKLVHFLHGLRAKVNLIPMNNHPGSSMKASSLEKIRAFQQYLMKRSIAAPVRCSRGQDISAACGQLAGKHQDEVHLSPQEISRQRRRDQVIPGVMEEGERLKEKNEGTV